MLLAMSCIYQTETKVSSLKVCFFLSFHAAEEAFKKLEQARDVLVDRQKRALYDQWRSGGFASLGITFKQWMKQPAFHSVSTLQQGYTLVAWCALDCMQQTVRTGLEHNKASLVPRLSVDMRLTTSQDAFLELVCSSPTPFVVAPPPV